MKTNTAVMLHPAQSQLYHSFNVVSLTFFMYYSINVFSGHLDVVTDTVWLCLNMTNVCCLKTCPSSLILKVSRGGSNK